MGAILAASPSPGLVGVARINWSSFLAAQPKVPCFLENFQHHKKSTGRVDMRVLWKLEVGLLKGVIGSYSGGYGGCQLDFLN